MFLVIQKKKKMVHKYKIIQTLSSSNFIYSVKYMIMFFIIYFRLIVFYSKLTHLVQIKNKKLRLDRTRAVKLNYN